MDSTSLNEKSCVWKIPAGSLIHIAGLPYETTEEIEVNGFKEPVLNLNKNTPRLTAAEVVNQFSSAARYEDACCKLGIDSNGRFYIEPSTSDGEEVLRKMLAEGIAVAVAPSKPHAATGAAEAME